jgi:hypothetical protein
MGAVRPAPQVQTPQRKDRAAMGRYFSRDLCLAYMNALEAGDPHARVVL